MTAQYHMPNVEQTIADSSHSDIVRTGYYVDDNELSKTSSFPFCAA